MQEVSAAGHSLTPFVKSNSASKSCILIFSSSTLATFKMTFYLSLYNRSRHKLKPCNNNKILPKCFPQKDFT